MGSKTPLMNRRKYRRPKPWLTLSAVLTDSPAADGLLQVDERAVPLPQGDADLRAMDEKMEQLKITLDQLFQVRVPRRRLPRP